MEINFSASSLSVAQKCFARLKAEYGFRAKEPSNSAARLGTLCHKAIEMFVQLAIIERSVPFTDKDSLHSILNAAVEIVGASPDEAAEALDILAGWQIDDERLAQLLNVEILSMEDLNSVEIRTKYGPRKLIYAIDRLERSAPGRYRIVDLKTTKYPLTPEEIYEAIQARVYAVVVAMLYPDATDVEFQMDYLRFSPVSITFTKAEIRRFYRELQGMIERILESDGTTETINDQCRFCLRAITCETLGKYKQAGASVGVGEKDLLVAAYESDAIAAGWKTRGKYALEELERILRANETDSLVIDGYEVSHKPRRERSVEKESIWKLVPELKEELDRLSPVAALDAAIKRTADPSVKYMLGMLATYKTTIRTKVRKLPHP